MDVDARSDVCLTNFSPMPHAHRRSCFCLRKSTMFCVHLSFRYVDTTSWCYYMSCMASQLIGKSVRSTDSACWHNRKRQILYSTCLCGGNPPDSLHKGLVTRKAFPCHDVIMERNLTFHWPCAQWSHFQSSPAPRPSDWPVPESHWTWTWWRWTLTWRAPGLASRSATWCGHKYRDHCEKYHIEGS